MNDRGQYYSSTTVNADDRFDSLIEDKGSGKILFLHASVLLRNRSLPPVPVPSEDKIKCDLGMTVK